MRNPWEFFLVCALLSVQSSILCPSESLIKQQTAETSQQIKSDARKLTREHSEDENKSVLFFFCVIQPILDTTRQTSKVWIVD